MTTHITDSLEDYYQLAIAWINAQYDNYPTALVPLPEDPLILAELAHNNALAEQIVAGTFTGNNAP